MDAILNRPNYTVEQLKHFLEFINTKEAKDLIPNYPIKVIKVEELDSLLDTAATLTSMYNEKYNDNISSVEMLHFITHEFILTDYYIGTSEGELIIT